MSELTVLLVVVVAVDTVTVVGNRAPEMLERRVYAQQQREQSQYSEASAAFTHTLDCTLDEQNSSTTQRLPLIHQSSQKPNVSLHKPEHSYI